MEVLDKPETLEAPTSPAPSAAAPAINRAEYQKLVRYLKKVERRLRFQQAMRLLPYGILAGGLVGLVAAIVSRVTPSLTIEQVALIAIPALAVSVLAVLLYALFRPRKLLDTARRADIALGLKERLSTAVEGHLNPDAFGYKVMADQQFNDARRVVENPPQKVSKALPVRVPRKQGFAALALIPLLVVALVLPNPFSDQVKENQAIKTQIEQEAQKIEQLKQQIEKQNPDAAKNDPRTQELLKQLEQAQKDLLDKSNNKDDALAALQKAEQELQNLADPNKTTAEKAALENLARTFNSSDATKPVGQALQQNSADKYDNAANELENLANNSKALDQLKNDSNQAQQLSDKLAKDAENFKNTNPDMSNKLQNLSDALKPDNLQQNPGAAQQAMKDLAGGLRQAGQDQQISEQMQQAQSQLQKSEQAINQASQKGTTPNQSGNQTTTTTTDDSTNGDPSGTDQSQADQNSQQSQPGNQGQQGQQGQMSQDQQSGQGQQGQQSGQQGQAQMGQQSGQGNQA